MQRIFLFSYTFSLLGISKAQEKLKFSVLMLLVILYSLYSATVAPPNLYNIRSCSAIKTGDCLN